MMHQSKVTVSHWCVDGDVEVEISAVCEISQSTNTFTLSVNGWS